MVGDEKQYMNMSVIRFETKPFKIGDSTILRLPQAVSAELPSRGMVLVEGTISGFQFRTPLEPDGTGSHWLKLDKALLVGSKARTGDSVRVELVPSKDWPEPDLPADLTAALAADPTANAVWRDITPMARWDWLRWIRATNNPETRTNHVAVALSKMKNGTRRPCCFNRSMSTDFSVSKNGVLRMPQEMVI